MADNLKPDSQLKAQVRRENAAAPRERHPDEWPSRRDFLKRVGAAALLAGTYGVRQVARRRRGGSAA